MDSGACTSGAASLFPPELWAGAPTPVSPSLAAQVGHSPAVASTLLPPPPATWIHQNLPRAWTFASGLFWLLFCLVVKHTEKLLLLSPLYAPEITRM